MNIRSLVSHKIPQLTNSLNTYLTAWTVHPFLTSIFCLCLIQITISFDNSTLSHSSTTHVPLHRWFRLFQWLLYSVMSTYPSPPTAPLVLRWFLPSNGSWSFSFGLSLSLPLYFDGSASARPMITPLCQLSSSVTAPFFWSSLLLRLLLLRS
jgi:hypothetical protein